MTTLAQIPATLNLATTVGNDLLFSLTVTENNLPYQFTDATITTAIYFGEDVQQSNFTTSTVDNVMSVILNDTATTALGERSFSWNLLVTKHSITNAWVGGTLSIVPPGFGGTQEVTASLEITTQPSVGLALNVGYNVIPAASLVPFSASDPLTEDNVQDALTELADAVAPRIPTVKSSIYIEDNAVATVVNQNVAAKVLGTFLAGPACQSCTYNGNRITYIGTRNTRVLAVASVDIDGPNNQTYIVQLRKNGNAVDGLRSKVRKTTAVAVGSIVGHIPLATNDFVELWITNISSASDPVVSDATFALMN